MCFIKDNFLVFLGVKSRDGIYKVVSVFNVGIVDKVDLLVSFVKILVSIILFLLIESELDEKIKSWLVRKYVEDKSKIYLYILWISCFF